MTIVDILFGRNPENAKTQLSISAATTRENVQKWKKLFGGICGVRVRFVGVPVNQARAQKLALATYKTVIQ